jgi:hypothetical protein
MRSVTVFMWLWIAESVSWFHIEMDSLYVRKRIWYVVSPHHTRDRFPVFSFADTCFLYSTNPYYLHYVPLLIPSISFSFLFSSLFFFYEIWTLLWRLLKWNSFLVLRDCGRVETIQVADHSLFLRKLSITLRLSGVFVSAPVGYNWVLLCSEQSPKWVFLNDFQTLNCSCHWTFHVSRRTSCSSAFKLNVHIRVTSGVLTIEHNSKWIKIYQQVNYVPMCQLQAFAHCDAQMPVLWRETHVSCRTAVELGDWLTY